MLRTYNYLLLALLACCLITLRPAQGQTVDSVSTDSGYTQQVWYNLETGETWSYNADDWDLAFVASGFGSSIRINGGQGVRVWTYPDGDTADWATLDTTGMAQNWPQLHNDPADWNLPAFSQGRVPNDAFDQGWGVYDIVTHHVTGDSLYVIKDVDGNYGKLWIERLASGTYTFRYEVLGSDSTQNFGISKDDYADRFFGYFSLTDGKARDLEPPKDDWDLLFHKYITFLSPAPGVSIPYGVTGIMLHPNARAIELTEVADPESEPQPDTAQFVTERNVIGYDWKNFIFQERRYEIEDSLVYFVEASDGNVFRFIPTGFGGSANGTYYFNVEKTSTVTGQPELAFDQVKPVAYPNPVVDGSLYIGGLEQNSGINTYQIHDVQGRQLQQGSLRGGKTNRINVSELPQGLYLLQMQSGNKVHTTRIQVQ